MANKLPDATALGERPAPRPSGGVASYQPDTSSAELAGKVEQQFGEMVSTFGKQQQDLQDTQRAEDGFNQIRTAATELSVGQNGYGNIRGGDAVKKPIVQDFNAKLADISKGIESQMGNEEQKRLYRQRAAVAAYQFNDHLLRHVAQESQVYAGQVFDGTVATELRNISAQFQDPNAVNASVLRMTRGADDLARSRGLDEQARNAIKADITDKAMTTRFTSWMYSDPIEARKAFKENADKISPTIRMQLDHQLKVAAVPLEARAGAAAAMGATGETDLQRAVATPPNTENLVSAVIQQESGGRQSAVSPKGAVGVMQVMPATAKKVAMEIGVPYDEQRLRTDEAYNRQLGTTYLNQQLQRFGGNQTLALAAYNAGPERVEEWVKTIGDPRTGAITNAEFASKIPFAETRAYVANINAKAAPTNSVDTRAMLSTWIDNAEREAQRTHPNDPIYRDAVLTEVKSKYNMIVLQQQGIEKQAHAQLMSAGTQGPDGQAPTTIAELTATPELKRAWQIVSANGDSAKGVMAMLDLNSKRLDRTDPKVMESIFTRIHMPDDNAEKITSADQLVPYFGKLGRTGYDWAVKDLDRQNSEGGKSMSANIDLVRKTGTSMLINSIQGSVQPDVAREAALRFTFDFNRKVAEYEKAFAAGDKTKDPRQLMPGGKDYPLAPDKNFVQNYLLPPNKAVADEASKVTAAGQAQGAIPPTSTMAKLEKGKEQAGFDALKPGDWFVAPDGRVGRKPGASDGERAPATGSAQWEAEHAARRTAVGDFATLDKEAGGQFGKGNIDLNGRQILMREKGSYSSLESITIGFDGKQVLLPTIDDKGKQLTEDQAVEQYKKTGKYLGKFDTVQEAKDYAIQLERRQQAYYEAGPGRAILDKASKGQRDEGPKMPELVEETGGRKGVKPDPAKARAQFAEAGKDYVRGMETAITAPLRLRAAVHGAVIRALTPDDAMASAKAFRQMVKTGKYNVANEQIIGDALASGLLSDQEKQFAQTMLERIDEKKKR